MREVLAAAVAMGATTIRAHSCGISVGPNTPYNLEPKLGVFNGSAWDARDYALFAAREYGLRVILPLTDNCASLPLLLQRRRVTRADVRPAQGTTTCVARSRSSRITTRGS